MRDLFIALTALLLISCGGRSKPAGAPVEIASPLGLPPLPIPADNPPTAETIALGAKLYFSPILSVDRTLSCADCHNPKLAFTDGQPVSTGVHGKKGSRNAPTILNAAFNKTQFWDGRADSLEAQVSGPMLNSLEMGHTLRGVESGVANDAELRPMFEAAFGPGRPTMEKITKAIASFERTLVSGNSPFDRYQYGGDKNALSAAAQRGLEVFRNPAKGNCAVCHTIEENTRCFRIKNFTISAPGWILKASSKTWKWQGRVSDAVLAERRADRALHARWQSEDAEGSRRLLRRRRELESIS